MLPDGSVLGAATLRPALRAGRAFRRDPLGFLQALPAGSDVRRFRVGFTEFALLARPEWIQRVLVTEQARFGEGKWTQRGFHVMRDCLITREGQAHRERRALLQPAFAERSLLPALPRMVGEVERRARAWRDGDRFDLRGEMERISLGMAVTTLFDAELGADADATLRSLGVMGAAVPELPVSGPRWIAARRQLRHLAARLARGPLVDRLRAAGLSEAAIRDEVISLLFASVDTTPSTLSWTWFCIGRHPEVEAKLHAELADVLSGRPPEAADLARLPTLDAVLSEVLRLYPPVHFIDRRALVDVDWGEARLRAGEYLLLSPLFTHRDPRFFERPESFEPDRWYAAGRRPGVALGYFPFGAGPHACIGRSLARLAIAAAFCTLASAWRLRPAPDLPAAPSPQTRLMPVRLERRR